MNMNHYEKGSATPEWILLSAELEHEASGATLERRSGRWIVDGVVEVDTFTNAVDLLSEAA
jgi:hypothetical protein